MKVLRPSFLDEAFTYQGINTIFENVHKSNGKSLGELGV